MKIRSIQFLFVLVAFPLLSCQDENLDADNCDLSTRICTEEFRTISLEVTNQEGDPLVLDEFYTFLDSRKKFEFELNDGHILTGIYPVITDAEIEELERKGTTLIFVGERNGKNLVEHQMVIGHDCCHVQLIEGENKIEIEE